MSIMVCFLFWWMCGGARELQADSRSRDAVFEGHDPALS